MKCLFYWSQKKKPVWSCLQQLTRRQHTLDSGKRLWNLNHLICWLTKQHKNAACAEEWAAIRPKDSPGECFYCPHGVKCAFISMNRGVNKAHSTADESLRRRHTHLTHTNTLCSQHTHTLLFIPLRMWDTHMVPRSPAAHTSFTT